MTTPDADILAQVVRLLEELDAVAFSTGADGRTTLVSRCWHERTGLTLNDGWLAAVEAAQRADVAARWEQAVALGEPFGAAVRIRAADGRARETRICAEPLRSIEGRIAGYVGVVTEPERPAREADSMFGSLVENSADFVGIASLSGEVLFVNDAGRRMLGIGTLDDARRTELMQYFMPDDAAFVREVILKSLEREGGWKGDFRFRHFRSGAPVPMIYNLFTIRDRGTGEPIAIATVSQDVTERRRSEQRLRTLVDAGAILSQSLDYVTTLKNLSRLVVDSFASFCLIDLFVESADVERPIQRVAAVHLDGLEDTIMARLIESVPTPEHVEHPVVRIFRDGSSSLVAAVDATWIDRVATSADHAAVFRELELRSYVAVPLVARGRIVGALSCGLGREARRRRTDVAPAYDTEDLFFLEELARRAGVAIDNARLYEHQHRIAFMLQEASLPRTLPAIDGLRLDADYRPGSEEATIGGDWYDAFEIGDGRVVLTVGDVLGKGLRAAITMTKLRQAMQAAAMVIAEPNAILDVADRTLLMHDPEGYATAFAAVYDARSRVLSFASAGHPPPFLRGADGRLQELSCPGLLLGMRSESDCPSSSVVVPLDALLVLYTDGLIEASRNLDVGNALMGAALARPGLAHGPSPARAIIEAVLEGADARDDVAVLTATFSAPSGRAAPSPALAPASERK